MKWQLQDRTFQVDIERDAEGRLHARVNGEPVEVEILREEEALFLVRHEGRQRRLYVLQVGRNLWLAVEGRVWVLRPVTEAREQRAVASSSHQDGRLRAPVPAQVREIRVQVGDIVHQGQVVAVLEAMKMEFRLQAPFDGVVQGIYARPGDVVERDQVVVEITGPSPASGASSL